MTGAKRRSYSSANGDSYSLFLSSAGHHFLNPTCPHLTWYILVEGA